MIKLLHVAIYEFSRHVLQRRFLLALFSPLLLLLAFFFLMVLAYLPEFNLSPIGYVDQAGVFTQAQDGLTTLFGRFIPFETETLAKAALQKRDIQAYYVLEPDYLQSGQVRLVSRHELGIMIRVLFNEQLRSQLLAGQAPEIAQRMTNPAILIIRSADGSREFSLKQPFSAVMPLAIAMLFNMMILGISGYLLDVIYEERQNRTLEVLATSVSPLQLLGGKLAGIMGIALTMMLFWGPLAFLFALARPDILASIKEQAYLWRLFLPLGLIVILAFVTLAAWMIIAAISFADKSDAQAISSVFSLIVITPMALYLVITENPHGALAIGLSFFPPTSAASVSLRAAVTSIPTTQIVEIIAFLAFCALCSIWLAAKLWRRGMQYAGTKLRWRNILRRASKGENNA